MENFNQAHFDIKKNTVSKHRWLCGIACSLFLVWGFIDFGTEETLAPVFFILRFLAFSASLIFITPLNKTLFFNHNEVITASLITFLTTANTFILLFSSNFVPSSIFQTILYLIIPILFFAPIKVVLPALIVPFLTFISGVAFVEQSPIFSMIGLLTMTAVSAASLIAQYTFFNFITGSNRTRLELEENKEKSKSLVDENNQLIRILCHDLGNGITILEMSTKLLKENLTPIKDQEKFFNKTMDRMKRAITNQQEIIEHVKEKEALESGKYKLELSPVSLNIVFEKVKFIFQEKLDEKNINLSLNNGLDKSPYVLAEMVSLSNNVFNNIISNAIKFSEDNGQIIISSWVDKENVFVTIEDFGIGMPEDLVKNIFATNIKTTRPGLKGERGTGFGMPLAKSYMQQYQGDIFVESKEGKGTRFTLKFKNISEQEISHPIDFKLAS